jgi:single-strand DNA-binding protein
MSSLNKVMLIGHLGANPEVRKTEAGMSYARFSVATHSSEARPDWHSVVVFGKLADTCQAYLTKGQACYIEGRLSYYKQERGEQVKVYTDIIANQIRFLTPKRTAPNASEVDTSFDPQDPSIDTHIPF